MTKYNFFKKISFISKYINTIPEKNIKKGWKCQFLILYAFRVYVTIEIRTNAIFFLFQAKLKVLEHYKQKKLNEWQKTRLRTKIKQSNHIKQVV